MKYRSTRAVIELFSNLTPRRRWQLTLVILLMLAGGISEVLSIGLIVPFLALLIDPLEALQLPFVTQIANIFNLVDPNDLRWFFTLLFMVAAIVSGAVRFAVIWVNTGVTFSIGHELGVEIYRRVINQSYAVHISRNSSEVVGAIAKVEPITHIIFGLLNGMSALLMSISIFVTLMFINPALTVFTIIGLGGAYTVVMLFVKNRLAKNDEAISRTMNDRFKVTQEAIGSIRDILLSHGQHYFSSLFTKTDLKYTKARASNLRIGPSPKFIVEAFAVLLITSFAYSAVMSTDGFSTMIPTLGAMVLGAQRLLPNLQLIYISITNLKGQEQLIFDVVELLDQPANEEYLDDLDPLTFENQIAFENVSFQFQEDSPMVLKGLSFSIAKGKRIGLAGPTGSGKSTTIDLLMGLLIPSTGEISVDGVPLTKETRLQWQKNIAHVPQDLYLMDASFAENIAFCKTSDDIDLQRVEEVAKLAHIHDFITSKPTGYQSLLGERGVQLSGGQRQRVGIARALYRKASILVLDEATSALDMKMEAAVMSSIEKIDDDTTIIMIAHRIPTLKNCDLVYQLEHGRITNKMKASEI